MKNVNERLKHFAKEKIQCDRINRHLINLNERIIDAKKKVNNLDFIAEKEAMEVQKLQDNNLKNLFLKYLGQGSDALEFEKQEMLRAFINLKKAQESLEILAFEKNVLKKQILKLDYDPEEYKKLLSLKEQMLDDQPKLKHKIVALDNKINQLVHLPQEIIEAKDAISELQKAFEKLLTQISLIENWNQAAYVIFGKGHLSTQKKKTYIKNNIALLSTIDLLTEKVNQELDDIKRNYELDIAPRLAIINNFFEVFFDNLVTDWIVKKGLKTAKKTIEICIDKIIRMELTLSHESESITKTIKALETEREKLIVSF